METLEHGKPNCTQYLEEWTPIHFERSDTSFRLCLLAFQNVSCWNLLDFRESVPVLPANSSAAIPTFNLGNSQFPSTEKECSAAGIQEKPLLATTHICRKALMKQTCSIPSEVSAVLTPGWREKAEPLDHLVAGPRARNTNTSYICRLLSIWSYDTWRFFQG